MHVVGATFTVALVQVSRNKSSYSFKPENQGSDKNRMHVVGATLAVALVEFSRNYLVLK